MVQKAQVAPATANPNANTDQDDEDLDHDESLSSSGAGRSGAKEPKEEETAATLTNKNFRKHPDMENFFRFIYDNDLRLEALDILDQLVIERRAKRKKPH